MSYLLYSSCSRLVASYFFSSLVSSMASPPPTCRGIIDILSLVVMMTTCTNDNNDACCDCITTMPLTACPNSVLPHPSWTTAQPKGDSGIQHCQAQCLLSLLFDWSKHFAKLFSLCESVYIVAETKASLEVATLTIWVFSTAEERVCIVILFFHTNSK